MKKYLMTFCLFSIFSNSFAKSVDFYGILEETLNNNRSLKAKKLDIESSKEVLNEAQGYSYGQLVFSENISRTNNAGYVFGSKLASREASFGDFGFSDFLTPLGAAIAGAANDQIPGDMSGLLKVRPEDLNNPQARTNFETKVTYQIPIFTGFKLESAQKMAKLQILAQKAKYRFDEKQLSLEVLRAYNGAVAAKEFIKAVKKAKEATSNFLLFANELYNEGLVTSIDVKQAKAYDMNVDAKIIEAQNSFDLAIAYLRFLSSNDNISDVKDFQQIKLQTSNKEELSLKALDQRDDFLWMKYNKDTVKEKITYDSADNYFQIGAMIEYGYNDDTFSVVDMGEHDYYLGAIGISYKIFDGFITKAKKEKAKIEHKKIQHYFDHMKDGIKLEIENNILNLKAKTKLFEQKQSAFQLAQNILEQSTQMYKNQLISMNELLLQQSYEQKAAAEVIFAKYEMTLAAAGLKLSTGEPLSIK